jgi:RNA polymerase sigma-70 factor (ECF subfamily)
MLSENEIVQGLMKWRMRITAAAWLVVRDTHAAEDIFQKVALKALASDLKFDGSGALTSWAFVVARRESLNWLRDNRREIGGLAQGVLDALEGEWKANPPSQARIDALRDCLEAVPAESRRVLRLRYFDGYDCGEIATQMGVGLDALYKRISRLHESLRNCVDGKLVNPSPQPEAGK